MLEQRIFNQKEMSSSKKGKNKTEEVVVKDQERKLLISKKMNLLSNSFDFEHIEHSSLK